MSASISVAVGLSALIFWTGASVPVWLRGFVALFLLAVVQQDLLRHKIPNLITFPAFALGLGLIALSPDARIGSALLGAGLIFVVLFLPFALHWVAAGDVKALMVLGLMVGSEGVWTLLIWTTLLSGLVAVVLLVFRGGGAELIERWKTSMGATLALRRVTYFRPAADAVAAGAHPKGVAIALGVLAMQVLGAPWSNG